MKTLSPSPPMFGQPSLDANDDTSVLQEKKKQKVEDAGITSSDNKEFGSANDDDSLIDEMLDVLFYESTKEERKKYYEALVGSDGFDVPYHKECCYLQPHLHISKSLDRIANAGIKQYNEFKGTNYELVKVVKNMSMPLRGSVHYITFEAKMDDKTETFEAKVFRRLPEGEPEAPLDVSFCRVKGSGWYGNGEWLVFRKK